MKTLFHIAFPVHNLEAARRFYGQILNCPEGRSDTAWIDFDLYGHQIVAHLSKEKKARIETSNSVDSHDVPVPHFGVILPMDEWHKLAERVRAAGCAIRYRTLHPLQRRAGRAGNDVFSRSERECAGI